MLLQRQRGQQSLLSMKQLYIVKEMGMELSEHHLIDFYKDKMKSLGLEVTQQFQKLQFSTLNQS